MDRDSEVAEQDAPPSGVAGTPLQSLVEGYTRYYASGDTHTARAKRLDLQHFLAFLAEHCGYAKTSKLKVRDWDFSAVQQFMDTSLAKGEAPATVARRLATLKHMGRTLAEKMPGFTNPAKEAKAPKITAAKPKALSTRELKAVLGKAKERIADKETFIRFRNRVILEFLVDTGLRADEVRLLRMSQIDEKLEWIKNVRTKGRRYRNVYITSKFRPRLKEYLERRAAKLKECYAKLSKSEDRKLPVFISTYNAVPAKPESFEMGAKTLWRAINELSAGTPLHPHLLRHSFALDLLESSHDVRLVSQALGHSDVRITMRYTERKDHEIAHALERSRKKSAA